MPAKKKGASVRGENRFRPKPKKRAVGPRRPDPVVPLDTQDPPSLLTRYARRYIREMVVAGGGKGITVNWVPDK